MNHAVMMIPEVMRLPFTFGLSGAMHVAALSSVVLPTLQYSYVPTPPIEVRLQHPFPTTHIGIASVPFKSTKSAQPSHIVIANIPVITPMARVDLPQTDIAITEMAALERSMPSPDRTSSAVALEALASGTRDSVHPVEIGRSEDSVIVDTAGVNNATVADATPLHARVDREFTEANGTIESPFEVPKALYAPLRKYPEEARWEGRTGQGSLGFRLKPDGSVDEEIKILRSSGHADLDATAVESLRRWRFALPPGAAPSSWYRYPFRFGIS